LSRRLLREARDFLGILSDAAVLRVACAGLVSCFVLLEIAETTVEAQLWHPRQAEAEKTRQVLPICAEEMHRKAADVCMVYSLNHACDALRFAMWVPLGPAISTPPLEKESKFRKGYLGIRCSEADESVLIQLVVEKFCGPVSPLRVHFLCPSTHTCVLFGAI